MNTSLIMLVLNLLFLVFLVLGFLFGLRGAKKSALSLGFFIGAICLTLIITPAVTDALLKINITYNGTAMPIKEVLISVIKENATVKELASSGSNTEALIQNFPQMIGNLVTFMALLLVVGFVFWIAYLITARCLIKKEKKKSEETNPISKTTPSYVSATGNVTYIKEVKPKKHRLVGGLIGAVHSLVFMIVFLIPICGTAKLLNQLAYSTEEITSTAVITLLDTQSSTQQGQTESENNYTPSAKLIQENFPPELLEITKCLDNSIVGNLCGIVNVNNYLYNGIAKCTVNGEKIVLTKEIDNVIVVYDNVEFLKSIDFTDATSVKTINFNKLRKAINALTDSGVVKSLAPELTVKYLDWLTREDISDLDPAVVDSLSGLRQQLDEQPNLKELVVEIKKMLSDESAVMSVFRAELLNLIDIAEMVVKSDLVNELVKAEPDIKNMISILHANNNALMNNLIDKFYSSDFVSLATLTAMNYGIDALQVKMDDSLKEESLDISKIVLSTAQNSVDASFLKSTSNFVFELYLNIDDCTLSNNSVDEVKFVETYGKITISNLATVLDDIKNMPVLTQFDVLTNLIANAKKLVLKEATVEDPTEKLVSNYLNLDCFITNDYSFKTDLENLLTLIDNAKAITFTEGEGESQKTVTLIYKLLDENSDIIDTLQLLSKDQLSSILRPATTVSFIKPLVNEIVDELNTKISESVSEVGDLLPPDIDVGEHIDEIIEVVDSVSDVLPILDKMDNLNNDKTLTENLKEQLDDNEKDSIASLLDTLQENANSDGIFKEAYDSLVEIAKDDSKSGLDGLAEIVEKNTTTDADTTTINWQAIIDEYLKTTA